MKKDMVYCLVETKIGFGFIQINEYNSRTPLADRTHEVILLNSNKKLKMKEKDFKKISSNYIKFIRAENRQLKKKNFVLEEENKRLHEKVECRERELGYLR